MRFVLPLSAAALVAVVVLWPQLTGGYGGLIAPMLLSAQVDGLEAMRMSQARYVGQTSGARLYAVTADSALLDPTRPTRVHLDRLAADIATKDQGELKLTARRGVYHRGTEKLDLRGGIELLTADGYRFATEIARVNLRRSEVEGQRPVAGAGPAGTLEADRFQIREGGDLLWFEGRVKVMLQPRPGPGPSS